MLKSLHEIAPDAAIFNVVEPYATQRTTNISKKVPKILTEYYDANLDSSTLEELRSKVIDFSITREEKENVEELTRKQSSNNLWWKYRTGRITASIFKSVCRTSIENPSASIVKNICYPGTTSFFSQATDYGKKMKTKPFTHLTSTLQIKKFMKILIGTKWGFLYPWKRLKLVLLQIVLFTALVMDGLP